MLHCFFTWFDNPKNTGCRSVLLNFIYDFRFFFYHISQMATSCMPTAAAPLTKLIPLPTPTTPTRIISSLILICFSCIKFDGAFNIFLFHPLSFDHFSQHLISVNASSSESHEVFMHKPLAESTSSAASISSGSRLIQRFLPLACTFFNMSI